jgi:hypothetical protein
MVRRQYPLKNFVMQGLDTASTGNTLGEELERVPYVQGPRTSES